MNTKLALAVITLLIMTLATPTFAKRYHDHDRHDYRHWRHNNPTYEIDRRRNRQSRRIEHGVASGQLTHREARRLFKKQRKINGLEDHFLSNGHLSSRERRILHSKRDRASDRIYRYKNNGRNHQNYGLRYPHRPRYFGNQRYRNIDRREVFSRGPGYGISVYYDRPRFGGHSW